ncbi:hypothetical protein NQZ68_010148, partial [Dissostichus eleginoides]
MAALFQLAALMPSVHAEERETAACPLTPIQAGEGSSGGDSGATYGHPTYWEVTYSVQQHARYNNGKILTLT